MLLVCYLNMEECDMWVCLNNAFISVVKDDLSEDYKVRARIREDLESLFDEDRILESTKTDYRFRVYATKEEVAKLMLDAVDNIDYTNFKDSVKEKWRHDAYLDIWQVMYREQTDRYGYEPWWLTYRDDDEHYFRK